MRIMKEFRFLPLSDAKDIQRQTFHQDGWIIGYSYANKWIISLAMQKIAQKLTLHLHEKSETLQFIQENKGERYNHDL